MKRHMLIYFIFCFFSVIHSMDEVVVESQKNKAVTIPGLDFDPLHKQPGSGRSPDSGKKAITDLNALKSAASSRLTARRNGGASGATTRNTPTRSRVDNQTSTTTGDSPPLPNSDILIANKTPLPVNNPAKKFSLLPNAVSTYSGKVLLQEQEEIWYSEEDMWLKLATFNPVLHAFGKKHSMSIEQVEEFAHFLQEHDVHPKVLTEHIHKTNPSQESNLWKRLLERFFGNTNEKRFNNFLVHFEKIKKENPDNWEELVLELMKATADQAEGLDQSSKIADLQTELLTRDNNYQADQIRTQWAAIVATVLTAAGGWAFGVTGQLINPTNFTCT